MHAIIATGGKQYLVTEGQKFRTETIEGEAGDKVKLDQVLLVTDDTKDGTKVGQPTVDGATVEAKIVEQGLGKKVRVYKKKSKKRYQREQGHRQAYTELEITSIKA